MKFKVAIIFAIIVSTIAPLYAQTTPVKVVRSQETTIKDGTTYYLHLVEKGQTVYSICKAYEVTTETLLEDNPSLISGLKEGSTILIRQGGKKISYIKHIVRWYDSLGSIAKKYNVSEKDIISANSLQDSRIVVRQLLLIPDSTGVAPDVEDNKTIVSIPEEKKTEEQHATINEEKKENRVIAHERNRNFNVSLVLPLGSKKEEIQDMDANFLDFYEGFLLALEDMKNQGMNLTLQVLDMSNYSSGTLLAQSGKLDKSDLIIGPIYEKEIAPVLEHVERLDIPIVSPMDPKTESLVNNHPRFYQVNTGSYNIQYNLLSSIPENDHITLIYEESGHDKELVDISKSILNKLGVTYNSISYGVLSGRGMTPKIGEKLSKTKTNAIVVLSNSEAFVSDVLRNLNLLNTINGYTISLYGTSKWRSFERVDINNYHSMNLHLAIQHYVDYNNSDVKKFLARFRAIYGCEPNPYSFQAYDVARYFLNQLYVYGPKFYKNSDNQPEELLQSDFKFERNSDSDGYVNTATRVVVYNPDFSININRFGR